MEIVISPYKDPGRGLDWHEQTPNIIKDMMERVCAIRSPSVDFEYVEENLGTAADWPVIRARLLTATVIVAFGIPETHKYIRESYEEWEIIAQEIETIVSAVAGEEPIVQCSPDILFFDALNELHSNMRVANLKFIDFKEIPVQESFGVTPMPSYVFSFSESQTIHQVAVKCTREIAWKNVFQFNEGA